MLTFTTLSLPSMSLEMSSSEGPIMRQGPHHSAQKSTSTGVSDFRTSCSKEASVALTVIWVSQKHFRPVHRPAPPLAPKLGTAPARVKIWPHKALIYPVLWHRSPSTKAPPSTTRTPLPGGRGRCRRAAHGKAQVGGDKQAALETTTAAAADWSCSRRSALRCPTRRDGRPGRSP